ncbi:MAG: hypothetical protein ACRDHO_01755 [Actinomycetota bacterium]
MLAMMDRTGVTGSVLALALVVTTCGAEPKPAQPALSEGDAAPAFSLPAARGPTVSMESFRGRAVLLYFSMGPG